jgi:hypothetical protein
MLRNIRELYGSRLATPDGDVGHVKDFYFDDATWAVRYLVADTSAWLTGRLMLISPRAFGRFDEVDGKALVINLTRAQIEGSPVIETHQPVSRQYEIEYHRYYGWPLNRRGEETTAAAVVPLAGDSPSGGHILQRKDKHLRSAKATKRYQVQTIDGVLGHASGFMVDDRNWEIRELVVEAGHWYSGQEFQLSVRRIDRISDQESKVYVNLTEAEIRKLPGTGGARPEVLDQRAGAPQR